MAMTILQFVCGLTVSYVHTDRCTSQASAHNRSGQEDVQKQESSTQAYLVPAQRLGLQGFLGWEAVSLAAQRSSLSADWDCFAREVLSWAGNVASCFLAVQLPHAQQNQVGPGWMATSTLRPVHSFLSASQPNPSCFAFARA